ncbi:MAG: hypothetical protein CMM47_03175 [Rhodospirillaceae bacterium]|nr:hypothetical protein [Rhodospirillaceae bacterium]
MDVTPLVPEGRQIVETYGDGGFRVSGVAYTTPIIVFPEHCLSWPEGDIDLLSIELLDPVFAAEEVPEILLLGCGETTVFMSPLLRAKIRERGPVVDVMNTGAACRTYNVLMTEARRVAAALLPVA